MSVDNKSGARIHKLKHVDIKKIRPSSRNPRLLFPQDELEQLTQSIDLKGILVPVVVAKNPEGPEEYVLVDGERRFRCARDLGHLTVPAVITDAQDDEATLIDMFNIHMVREPWKEMPTAWALKDLIAAREKRSESVGDADLAEVTGLTTDQLKRLRHALELPKAWQDYIHNGTIPLNFFWELRVNVIEPIANLRPKLMEQLGRDRIQQAFVDKRIADVVTDVVSLRKVRKIVAQAHRDAGGTDSSSVLDETLHRLVTSTEFSIDDAYDESIEVLVELDRIQRKCDNMVKAFARLLEQTQGTDKRKVKAIGKNLMKKIGEVIA